MSYSDFSFYKNTAHGALTQDQYDRYADDAAAIIDQETDGKAKAAAVAMVNQIKMCECHIVDTLFTDEELAHSGVVSVDNDGFKQTFGTLSQQAEMKRAAIQGHCKLYLRYPINLMYKGKGRCCCV